MPIHSHSLNTDPESIRLSDDQLKRCNWKLWGPYLSERQWGTVREDYSENGDAWNSFSRDQASSRAYRWGEDGLMGWSDRHGKLCFSLTLWNQQDDILKERLFGLTNPEGNHGEDVKELYYYLDSTPTHSYAKSLYKYPQASFPYQEIIAENAQRTRLQPEYEIEDTGIFDENRFFDIETTYSKAGPEDILIEIKASNRGPDTAPLVLLPTLWFRNTWSWGRQGEDMTAKPNITMLDSGLLQTDHESLPPYQLAFEGEPEVWFTDNESNHSQCGTQATESCDGFSKDAFSRHLIHRQEHALRADNRGTKVGLYYQKSIPSGESVVIRLRLSRCDVAPSKKSLLAKDFSATLSKRREEADAFYDAQIPSSTSPAERAIMRQAYAGLLWSKQFYHIIINDWLDGDPANPAPASRRKARNSQWNHLFNRDIISMPDTWEYPWYAAWDLAFHMLPMAEIDPKFAKHQLSLFLREWYMHPNGQLPAYEWNFSDVNPPVHAWAVWRVYKIAKNNNHQRDFTFLSSAFQKLLLNFTWWVNQKDPQGNNIFAGGFLGLDNIGVFDRSYGLPSGADLEQADGTAWMAFYCTTMLAMALELAAADAAYEDLASKFFEHYATISLALNGHGRYNGLWCERDGFYYDWLTIDGNRQPLAVRSLVGLIPLIAVEVLDQKQIKDLKGFNKRTDWFLKYRPHLAENISSINDAGDMRLLSVCPLDRLRVILNYLFDEDEFLSPFGIRSLSKYHEQHPFTVNIENQTHSISYTPGESDSSMFGGNSNWRGPIWFPMNYLIIEALERYHHFYGDSFQIEFPTGSGNLVNLKQAALLIGERLIRLFHIDPSSGARPAHGRSELHRRESSPEQELIHFYEYFNAETGEGLGASHQTGWTALVNRLIRKHCCKE